MPRKPRGNGNEGGKPPSSRSHKKTTANLDETPVGPFQQDASAHTTLSPICSSAASIKPIDMEWLLPSWIPQTGITLICGPTNIGKSTFLAALAAQVSGGPTLLGGRTRPASQVLWYVSELDPATMLVPRLKAAEADLTRVFFPGHTTGSICTHRLSLPSEIRLVHDEVIRRRASLVLLDPVTSFLDPTCSPIDGQAVRSLMDTFALLSQISGTAFVFACHYRKGRGGSPLDWVAGSGSWVHCARCVIALGEHPEVAGQFVMASAKPGLGAMPPSRAYRLSRADNTVRFQLLNEVGVTALQMGESTVGPGERDALADAKEFLVESIGAGPRPVNELEREADAAGISRSTLRRAKEALKVKSVQESKIGASYWVWQAPDAGWPR